MSNQPQRREDAVKKTLETTSPGVTQTPYDLTPEEEADINASPTEAARGEFATDEEVRAVWAKHGCGGPLHMALREGSMDFINIVPRIALAKLVNLKCVGINHAKLAAANGRVFSVQLILSRKR